MGENVISHRPATSLPCVDYFLFFLSLFEREVLCGRTSSTPGRRPHSAPCTLPRGTATLKADWLDERPTSNGGQSGSRGVISDILPTGTPGGGGCSAAGPASPPPSPRDLQRCLKVRQVRHRAPPRYTKCACGRTLTDHRSQITTKGPPTDDCQKQELRTAHEPLMPRWRQSSRTDAEATDSLLQMRPQPSPSCRRRCSRFSR